MTPITFARSAADGLVSVPGVVRDRYAVIMILAKMAGRRRDVGGKLVYRDGHETDALTCALLDDLTAALAWWLAGLTEVPPVWTTWPDDPAELAGVPAEVCRAARQTVTAMWESVGAWDGCAGPGTVAVR